MSEHSEAISIKERAKRKLERDMGPAFLAALYDPKTVELMLNGPTIERVALPYVAALAKIGITMKVNAMPRAQCAMSPRSASRMRWRTA